ncbi:3'5'-cyclic nucleotide phosphodiesterase-like protein [Sarcoptes scabiei]|uniref:Phosphodiesterase n=1 Tax=Sarcoptes scabiei TaxID=52283 RepID=A0A131ZVG0_SARSC|nr:3'5'-cyclic nucleotide phosphodiesterase-like protein [Sarcoptes scabiei]
MTRLEYLEKGYHDTNPYHNSVHAADVTQAMHCFLQDPKIKEHLTPLEAMCSLLAAVSHDLDHPGVNQQFLIATNSHLTTMHNNLSVLESHHWRFAISCFYESHIFDHFDEKQWREIKFLLKHLILATDISRQNEYIQQFKAYIENEQNFNLANKEHRYFILQIALKCADLGNPCRPWKISQRWSEQICNEFYRQGDFEKLLGLTITPMCDRASTTISKTQTDFFSNVVRPLFELWHIFLNSKLSNQLMNNLDFNDYMWKNMESNQSTLKRCHSLFTLPNELKNSQFLRLPMTTSASFYHKSCTDLSSLSVCSFSGIEDFRSRFCNLSQNSSKPKCVDGCGTPTTTTSESKEEGEERGGGEDGKTSLKEEISSNYIDVNFDEEDDFIADFNCGAILSTPALILPNFYCEKPQCGFSRRGSAPGSIDLRISDLKSSAAAKGTAVWLLCNALKANNISNKRRSSFPNVKISKSNLNPYNASLQSQLNRFNAIKNISIYDFGGNTKPLKTIKASRNGGSRNRSKLFDSSTITASYHHHLPNFHHHHHSSYQKQSQQQSMFDIHNFTAYHYAYFSNNNGDTVKRNSTTQRRRSVPQDIFIRSLNDYHTA